MKGLWVSVLHESESYDTLNTINKGAGNMLYAMGLAAPVVSIYSGLGASYDFAKYSTYSNSTNYDAGDFVKVADGASFTYWQALQDTQAKPRKHQAVNGIKSLRG